MVGWSKQRQFIGYLLTFYQNLEMVHLKMAPKKRRFSEETLIFSVHVSFLFRVDDTYPVHHEFGPWSVQGRYKVGISNGRQVVSVNHLFPIHEPQRWKNPWNGEKRPCDGPEKGLKVVGEWYYFWWTILQNHPKLVPAPQKSRTSRCAKMPKWWSQVVGSSPRNICLQLPRAKIFTISVPLHFWNIQLLFESKHHTPGRWKWYTLPRTNIFAPEKRPKGNHPCFGAFAVSSREEIYIYIHISHTSIQLHR